MRSLFFWEIVGHLDKINTQDCPIIRSPPLPLLGGDKAQYALHPNDWNKNKMCQPLCYDQFVPATFLGAIHYISIKPSPFGIVYGCPSKFLLCHSLCFIDIKEKAGTFSFMRALS